MFNLCALQWLHSVHPSTGFSEHPACTDAVFIMGKIMFNARHVQLLCISGLMICTLQAYAVNLIPVQCVVTLKKNDAIIDNHAGPCSYEIPFVVVNDKSIIYRTGVKGGAGDNLEWNTKEIWPGFSATIGINHNVSAENPLVNVSVDFSFMTLLEPQKMTAILNDGKAVDYNVPVIATTASSGSVIVGRGQMELVSVWKGGDDSYQVYIGIR